MEMQNKILYLGIFVAILLVGFSNGQGDLMVDTAMGEEIFNPLLTAGLDSAPAQPSTGLTQQSGQQSGQNTGVGFDNLLIDQTAGAIRLALDPSSIAGIADGQTIYLSGTLGNQYLDGLPISILTELSGLSGLSTTPNPALTTSNHRAEAFSIQTEPFTLLGNVGHNILVPKSAIANGVVSRITNIQDTNASQTTTHGNTTHGPLEVVGVADLDQFGQIGIIDTKASSINKELKNIGAGNLLQSAPLSSYNKTSVATGGIEIVGIADFNTMGLLGNTNSKITTSSSHTVEQSQGIANKDAINTLHLTDAATGNTGMEIIGVADMSQLDKSGNPTMMSFNPGSGHASELAVLQAALLGSAVDMSSFEPPPFESEVPGMGITFQSQSSTNVQENPNSKTTFSVEQQVKDILNQGPESAVTSQRVGAIVGQLTSDTNTATTMNTRNTVSNQKTSILSNGPLEMPMKNNAVQSNMGVSNSVMSVSQSNSKKAASTISGLGTELEPNQITTPNKILVSGEQTVSVMKTSMQVLNDGKSPPVKVTSSENITAQSSTGTGNSLQMKQTNSTTVGDVGLSGTQYMLSMQQLPTNKPGNNLLAFEETLLKISTQPQPQSSLTDKKDASGSLGTVNSTNTFKDNIKTSDRMNFIELVKEPNTLTVENKEALMQGELGNSNSQSISVDRQDTSIGWSDESMMLDGRDRSFERGGASTNIDGRDISFERSGASTTIDGRDTSFERSGASINSNVRGVLFDKSGSSLTTEDRDRSLQRSSSGSSLTTENRDRSLQRSNSGLSLTTEDRNRSLQRSSSGSSLTTEDRDRSLQRSDSGSSLTTENRDRSLQRSSSGSSLTSEDRDRSLQKSSASTTIDGRDTLSKSSALSMNKDGRDKLVERNSASLTMGGRFGSLERGGPSISTDGRDTSFRMGGASMTTDGRDTSFQFGGASMTIDGADVSTNINTLENLDNEMFAGTRKSPQPTMNSLLNVSTFESSSSMVTSNTKLQPKQPTAATGILSASSENKKRIGTPSPLALNQITQIKTGSLAPKPLLNVSIFDSLDDQGSLMGSTVTTDVASKTLTPTVQSNIKSSGNVAEASLTQVNDVRITQIKTGSSTPIPLVKVPSIFESFDDQGSLVGNTVTTDTLRQMLLPTVQSNIKTSGNVAQPSLTKVNDVKITQIKTGSITSTPLLHVSSIFDSMDEQGSLRGSKVTTEIVSKTLLPTIQSNIKSSGNITQPTLKNVNDVRITQIKTGSMTSKPLLNVSSIFDSIDDHGSLIGNTVTTDVVSKTLTPTVQSIITASGNVAEPSQTQMHDFRSAILSNTSSSTFNSDTTTSSQNRNNNIQESSKTQNGDITAIQASLRLDVTNYTAINNVPGANIQTKNFQTQNRDNTIANAFMQTSEHISSTGTIATEVQQGGAMTEIIEPHVNDLSSGGIYPFEGSLSARDATLQDGKPLIMDFNNVIETETTVNDTLHLENAPSVTAKNRTEQKIGTMTMEGTVQEFGSVVDFKPTAFQSNSVQMGMSDLDFGSVSIGRGRGGGNTVETMNTFSLQPASSVLRPTVTSDAGGGFAIGSSNTIGTLSKISLPDRALKERNQGSTISVAFTKKEQTAVDMSSFVPPPVEGPTMESRVDSRSVTTELNRANTDKAISSFSVPNQVKPRVDSISLSADFNRANKDMATSFAVPNQVVNNLVSSSRVSNTKMINNNMNTATGNNVGKEITQPSNGINRVDTFNLARSWSNMSNTGSGLSVSTNNNSPLLSATSTEQVNVATSETRKPFMPSSWQMSRASVTGGLALPDSIAVDAPRGQPIVGSIFGSSEGSSKTITQNVVDRASIDQEPSRDFMASFLNPKNGPLRTLNLGKQSVDIVPIGSDMSKANTNANNMFIVGRGKSSSVFEPSVTDFGISEVYTRKQELDANQWNTFLKSISQNSNIRRNNVPYQTQNILSSSGIRPLDAIDLSINSISNPTASLTVDPKPMVLSNPSISVSLNSGRGQAANIGPDYVNTMFSAPGIGGHRSIPIPTVMTRPDVVVPSTSSAGRTNRIVTETRRNTQTIDSGSPPVSSSSISTSGSSRSSVDSVFDNTIDVQRRLFEKFIGSQGSEPLPNSLSQRPNTGLPAKPTRTTDSAPVPTASLSVQQHSSTRVDRRPTNMGKTADHSDFKLGKSILISDGVIPSFVQDTQQTSVSTADLQNMASSGFRLGEPVVMTRTDITQNDFTSVRSTGGGQSAGNDFISVRSTGGQQSAGNDFTSVRSAGGVQLAGNDFTSVRSTRGQQSANVNPTSSTLGLVITQDFGGNANTVVSGEQISLRDNAVVNQALSAVQRAAIAASGSTAEATKFTSGNRIAVFGPANGADERAVNRMLERSYKPAKATRMGILGPVIDCRYKPDSQSQYYFIYKNGATEHRFRCALGTAFDEMTCECSIRVSDHDDCLEVHMDFNNGMVEDSSLNNLPIGNENVEITNSSSPLAGIALFGGDGKLTIWRYQNYDFRNHIMLKVQFRPGPGGDRIQTLISNCGSESPSIAILYDTNMKEVVLILKTDNDTQKDLRFKVDPTEWNDVTFIYDGMEFIGIVNGVRRYVSKQDPHLLGIIGGEIKSVATKGLIEIRDSAVSLGQCPMYGNYIGAMVDIQVYTCIPRDFRLE